MPRRDRYRQQHFVLDQRPGTGMGIRRNTVEIVDLRSFATRAARQHQQVGLDRQRIRQTTQTTLAPEIDFTFNLEVEPGAQLCVTATGKRESQISTGIEQAVCKPRQLRYLHFAVQLPAATRKFQTIYDSLCRHRPRMIVFLRFSVKTK